MEKTSPVVIKDPSRFSRETELIGEIDGCRGYGYRHTHTHIYMYKQLVIRSWLMWFGGWDILRFAVGSWISRRVDGVDSSSSPSPKRGRHLEAGRQRRPILPHSASSVWVSSGLDEAYPCWGRSGFASLSLSVKLLISSWNIQSQV